MRLKDPKLVQLACSFQDPRKIYMVLEYAEGGSFVELINVQAFSNPGSLPAIKFYVAEMVLILEYLH